MTILQVEKFMMKIFVKSGISSTVRLIGARCRLVHKQGVEVPSHNIINGAQDQALFVTALACPNRRHTFQPAYTLITPRYVCPLC